MKNILSLALLVVFSSLLAKPVELSNSKIKVVYNQQKLSFFSNNSENPFVKEAALTDFLVDRAETVKATHPVFGRGSALVLRDKQRNSVKVSLFETLPFVMIQKTINNSTREELKVVKMPLFEGEVDLGIGASALKTNSTAGLKVANQPTGSYMFLAVGNPKNNQGVVCAWLTTQRGSGIVFSESVDDKVLLKARIDYGDLRIPAGKTAESEVLLVGYGSDVRSQLEAYGDAIALNMKINLHPQPTIYCTWYHGTASNDKKISENTDFASTHLKQYGLGVMQIDDYWQDGIKNNGPKRDFTKVNPKGPYPLGMKKTADYIKSKGMTAGIWYIPFAGSWYDEYWKDKMDLFLKEGEGSDNYFGSIKIANKPVFEKGKVPFDASWGGTCLDLTNPKALDYVAFIANRLSNEWGYKYFKMDGLWTGSGTRIQYVNSGYKDDDMGTQIRFNTAITPIEGYVKGFETIRKAAGDDIFMLGCCAPQNMRSFGAAMGRVDAMRVGPDNGANLSGLSSGAKFASRVFFLNKRVWYNDPDPGYPRADLPVEISQTFMSWISLSGSLHGTSEQYADLPAERLDLLRKSMPSHDLKTVRPVDYLEKDVPAVWHLTDKRDAVQKDVIGLFNFDVDKAQNISCALDRVDLPKAERYVGFDFWANKFISPFSGVISGYLAPGACKIISIRPETNYPQVVSTSRHLTQGVVEMTNEKWNAGSQTLSATSQIMGNDEYEVRVIVPTADNSWLVESITTSDPSVKTSFVQEGNTVRVKLNSIKDQKIDWSFHFKKGNVKPLEATNPIVNATIDLDQIVVKWTHTSPYQYRLFKNGKQLGELSGDYFVDKDLKLGETYKYGVQAKSWNGKWTESSEVSLTMPTSYLTSPFPGMPTVSCSELKAAGDVKNNMSYSGQEIIMDGKVQSNVIGVPFSKNVKYQIPSDSKNFVSTVFMESGEGVNPNYQCVFAIYGDVLEMGEPPVELVRSPGLKPGEIWNFNIALNPRYKQIKLVSRPFGSSSAKANVVWVNAGFVK